MAGMDSSTRASDNMIDSFSFNLVKPEATGEKLKKKQSNNIKGLSKSWTLQPKIVRSYDGVKIKNFDKERHFACTKKKDGSYECVEVDTEEYGSTV